MRLPLGVVPVPAVDQFLAVLPRPGQISAEPLLWSGKELVDTRRPERGCEVVSGENVFDLMQQGGNHHSSPGAVGSGGGEPVAVQNACRPAHLGLIGTPGGMNHSRL